MTRPSDDVGLPSSQQDVVTRSTDELSMVDRALQVIVARASVNAVATTSAVGDVVTVAHAENVIAVAAISYVAPTSAKQHVIARQPPH